MKENNTNARRLELIDSLDRIETLSKFIELFNIGEIDFENEDIIIDTLFNSLHEEIEDTRLKIKKELVTSRRNLESRSA